ncbi:MAG TPA: amino acid ABC transporter permease [Candidatus Ornithoclostridium excrementipullorum]|nr:amino acid ABC transporter permease [Candidatus Ornithoclostridium excrementipullorum]
MNNSMKFDLSLIFNKDALTALGEAYGWTIFITASALIIGILLGTMLAVCKVIPKTNAVAKVLDKIASTYVAIFRGTPLTVQLFIFSYIIFTGVILFNRRVTPYMIAAIGFGLNSAAYVSEIFRAGILSVDKGQMEAGRALGLSYGKTMKSIILPQAAKNIIPPLGNEAITLVKDTSVAYIIGVTEFFTAIKSIASSTYNVVTPYIFSAAVYFVTVLIMTICLSKLEKRLRRSDVR